MLSHGNVVADFAGFLKVTDVSVVFIASVAAFLYHTVLFHLFFSDSRLVAESHFP